MDTNTIKASEIYDTHPFDGNARITRKPRCEFLVVDVLDALNRILKYGSTDALRKENSSPSHIDLVNAYNYAVRQDVDGYYPYETEFTNKMAGYLNMSGFTVDYNQIREFLKNH